MSRIGKKPVSVPDKVTVTIQNNVIDVKGPKGALTFTYNSGVVVEKKENTIVVSPADSSLKNRGLWGLTRTLVGNMVTGVTDGFTKTLEFNGVGYKAAVAGNVITLNLGYSHPIEYTLPVGIEVKVTKNVIDVIGCDKELVGFVAAKIRSFRGPEPYKGKGIKYANETIIRKAGKTGKK